MRECEDRSAVGWLLDLDKRLAGVGDAVVGVGGAGKTAIADRFLRLMPGVTADSSVLSQDTTLPTPKSVFVFSFYKDNEDRFLSECSAWLKGHSYDETAAVVSFHQTLDLLRDSDGVLLVLDLLYDPDDPQEQLEHPSDKMRRGKNPRIFSGVIASANELLKDPKKRDALREHHGVKAIEMEMSGVADATWHHSTGYLGVRGICDYCDSHKNYEWQEYASCVAAAYTRALLESMPAQVVTANP